MKKLLKGFVVVIIFSFILMGLCSLYHPTDSVRVQESPWAFWINADAPIDISSNADFDIYDSGGDGQPGTPWILENYVINASGLGVSGILIYNTDAHFILRNCMVTGTDAGNAAIRLENVTNGYLYNNTVEDNGQNGIVLRDNSDYNMVTNNTATGNNCGFHVFVGSDNNTLSYNIANNNTQHGIYLQNNCDNNTLISNTATGNGAEGIHLSNSHDTTLTDNTANENTGQGITIISSDGIRLLYNTAIDNDWDGFYIYHSDNNFLIGNIVSYNDDDGMTFMECHNNTLVGNTVVENAHDGLYFWGTMGNCKGNAVFQNFISKNGGDGVFLYVFNGPTEGHENCQISDNIIIYNGYNGVDNDPWSYNTTIYHNLICYNWDGSVAKQIEDNGLGTIILDNVFENPNAYWGFSDLDGDNLIDVLELEYGTNPVVIDTDNDRLSDYVEIFVSLTSANNPDTDGDGLSDGDETILYQTDPNLVDTDGDGLSDGNETMIHQTDPNLVDTDGDGLSDPDELGYNTDPCLPDTDWDNLNDAFEVTYGINPLSNDTDGDGLLDWSEVTVYFTNATLNDTDGDGYTDYTEVVAGTNPLDVSDYPGKVTQEPVDWLPITIIIAGILVAAALVLHAILMRSRPVAPPPPVPRQASPAAPLLED